MPKPSYGREDLVFGRYRFAVSPNETNIWRGLFKDAIVKPLRYYLVHNYMWAVLLVPGFAAYSVYSWGNAENMRLSRKNPKDFENDV